MTQPDGKGLSKTAELYKLEKEKGWFDTRFDGWSPWRVVRTTVYNRAYDQTLSEAGSKRAKVGLGWQALLATSKFLISLLVSKKTDYLVKSFRSALRLSVGGVRRDIYFDDLLDNVSAYFKLEVVDNVDFDNFEAVRRPANLDSVCFSFWASILARILPCKSLKPFCVEISGALDERNIAVIDVDLLLRRVSHVYWESKLYRLLIVALRPKIVIVADCAEYALRLACAKESIFFMELQHGVFNREHPDAIPNWVSGSDDELLIPNALACFGRYWVDQLFHVKQGRNAFIAGNSLIDRYKLLKSKERRSGVLRILISSQGHSVNELCRWVRNMMISIPPSLVVELTIKLHPRYDHGNTAYDVLEATYDATIVDGASTRNIWELLSDSDIHLSISSACHFDAASLNVVSIVVPLDGYELLVDAIDNRSIFLANEPSDVWRIALTVDSSFESEESGNFCAPDFVENIGKFLGSKLDMNVV